MYLYIYIYIYNIWSWLQNGKKCSEYLDNHPISWSLHNQLGWALGLFNEELLPTAPCKTIFRSISMYSSHPVYSKEIMYLMNAMYSIHWVSYTGWIVHTGNRPPVPWINQTGKAQKRGGLFKIKVFIAMVKKTKTNRHGWRNVELIQLNIIHTQKKKHIEFD